jgi:hypothetical protein
VFDESILGLIRIEQANELAVDAFSFGHALLLLAVCQ